MCEPPASDRLWSWTKKVRTGTHRCDEDDTEDEVADENEEYEGGYEDEERNVHLAVGGNFDTFTYIYIYMYIYVPGPSSQGPPTPMVSPPMFSYGFLWFSCGFPMVFLRFSGGFSRAPT